MDRAGVGERDSDGQSSTNQIGLPGRRQARYAVFFSLIMVTSVIVPFVAMTGSVVATPGNGNGPPSNPGNGNGPPTETPGGGPAPTPTPGENETTNVTVTTPSVLDAVPVLQQYRAVQLSANLTGGQSARAHERLNAGLQYYSGPVRLNESHAFTLDAQAIRSLASANESGNATRAAELVYQADNTTATTAVADARRVLDRFGDDMTNQGRRNAAEQHLRNAERALERGQDVTDGEQFFQSRARTLNHLRQAHRHAQRAMRFVNAETTPEVSIATEADPVWNGNGTRPYTIRGNLTTVRPSTISNVTVTVNGNRTVQAQTGLSLADPGTNASYRATVNLSQRVSRLVVTVTDGASDGANQPGQQDTAILRVDGDGLPESYETNIVGTDPLDFDSDSDVTSADEADNGTIDGREDFDGDRLTTIEEFELGTDPHDADTDDDTLTDWEEVAVVEMDPLDSDSDSAITNTNESANGTLDGAEDLDGDGLTNAEEFANGSSPLYVDGDVDGLTDPEELELGTDPLNPDTDEDGLRDALELEEPFTTDPLDEDTDDDGVLDGNETYTTSVTNESVDATIEVTGPGHAAAGASVRNETQQGLRNDLTNPARVTEYVTYTGVDTESNASVAMAYDEGALPTNESDLALYRLNRSTGILERLNSTVDDGNDTVRAPIAADFGTVAALSPSVLDAQIPDAGEIDDNDVNKTTFDDTDIEDCSGNCSVEDGSLSVGPLGNQAQGQSGSSQTQHSGIGILSSHQTFTTISVPENATQMEFAAAVTASTPSDRGGGSLMVGSESVFSIGSDESVDTSVSSTIDVAGKDSVEVRFIGTDVTISVGNIESTFSEGGGGDDGDNRREDRCQATPGISDNPCPDSSASPVTISVPAGADDIDRLEIDVAGEATVIGNSSVGVSISGARSDQTTWETNGSVSESWRFNDVEDDIELSLSTEGMAVLDLDRITIWQDTDGDGFSDKREEVSGFYSPMFGRITTDPLSADTDGDGLDDDVEISHRADPGSHAFGVPWVLNSHPARVDGDGDGLTDPEERSGWEIQVVNSSLHNEVERYDYACNWGDCDEPTDTIRVTSDPLAPDTDEDGLDDFTEREETHTDPDSQVTYEITRDHQRIIDRLEARNDVGLARTLGISAEGLPLSSIDLTDATDDFDVVTQSLITQPGGVFQYTALDGTERTDMWLNNQQEIVHGTGVWDPDSDGDGLTDGQEVIGLTDVSNGRVGMDTELDYTLDPMDVDTDDDGYWDGWIGVHGINRSENLILYRENLQHQEGITRNDRDQMVSQQIGVHNVRRTSPIVDSGIPSVYSANIDDDDWTEHSNIHIGELHWRRQPGTEGHPANGSIRPSTSLIFEVDYYAGTNLSHQELRRYLDRIHQNFQLYDLNISFVIDERLSHAQVAPLLENGNFTSDVALAINNSYHDDGSVPYLFFGGESDGPGGEASSKGGPASDNPRELAGFGAIVYANEVTFDPGSSEHERRVAKTTLHEVGHLIGSGRADDHCSGGEVYSGGVSDCTKEAVMIDGASRPAWSIQINGWTTAISSPPIDNNYIPYSIEEVSTINFHEIDSAPNQ